MQIDQTAPLLPAAALGSALALAVWNDMKARRIPNLLICVGTTGAILLHLFLPVGAGLFGSPAGAAGFGYSLSGFFCGMALLLPFYALNALGAGDVKLMAMVGAFLGPAGVLGATLLSMLAGGLLALVVALWSGQLRPVLGNVGHMLRSALARSGSAEGFGIDQPVSTTGKLPYAIAIACGTLLHLALREWSQWRVFS